LTLFTSIYIYNVIPTEFRRQRYIHGYHNVIPTGLKINTTPPLTPPRRGTNIKATVKISAIGG